MTDQSYNIRGIMIHRFRLEAEEATKAITNWQSLDNETRAEWYEEARVDCGKNAKKEAILIDAVERAYDDTQDGKDAAEARALKLQADNNAKNSDRNNQVVEYRECKKSVKRGACVGNEKMGQCFHCFEKKCKAEGWPDGLIRHFAGDCLAYL